MSTPEEQLNPTKRIIADLEKANKELLEKNKQLEIELSEAAEIVSGIGKERDASDEAEKQQLIHLNAQDSRGYLRKDLLAQLSLVDNRLIRKNFIDENNRDYLEYFNRRRAEQDAGEREPQGTVGEWDPKTKKWKGGI